MYLKMTTTLGTMNICEEIQQKSSSRTRFLPVQVQRTVDAQRGRRTDIITYIINNTRHVTPAMHHV